MTITCNLKLVITNIIFSRSTILVKNTLSIEMPLTYELQILSDRHQLLNQSLSIVLRPTQMVPFQDGTMIIVFNAIIKTLVIINDIISQFD